MNQMEQVFREGPFIRSRPQISRPTTRSQRNSSIHNTNLSLKKKLDSVSIANQQDNLEIYFNHKKRKAYFINVIDNYFQNGPSKSFLSLDITPTVSTPLRANASSQSRRGGRKIENINLSHIKLRSRVSMMDFNVITDIKTLPIIEEDKKTHKRPVSQHKIPSILSIDRDIDDSLFLQSNKSILQNSNPSHLEEVIDQFQRYKIITVRKGSKKFSKTRVFNSYDNPQLIRQHTAKRLGMDLLWTQSIDNKSIQYPNYKNLRELCYSIVQDRKGEEPLILIYPNPYYFSLFANGNEELIDIILSLVKGIIKGKGNISNNQIHIQNIVKMKQKKFYLADWGCGAFRQSMIIQGRTFSKDLTPFCKDGSKWVVIPEYLSPQILKATQTGYYEHLWKQKGGFSSCDVWSLGCMIYELITLIPLTSPHFCVIKGKQQRKRGYFSSKTRSTQKILIKQRNFKGIAIRSIKQQMRQRKQLKINQKILQILPKMLEQFVQNRITAEQILIKLS